MFLKYIVLISLFTLVLGIVPFSKQCLEVHNMYRHKHGAPPLDIDAEIQNVSEKYARKLANEMFKLVRSDTQYGENLYLSSGALVNAELTVSTWYSGIKDYNFKNPALSKGEKYLLFTQIVWKATKRLGCAFARNGDMVIVVANYEPAGNIPKEFKDNVAADSTAGHFRACNSLQLFVSIFAAHCFYLAFIMRIV